MAKEHGLGAPDIRGIPGKDQQWIGGWLCEQVVLDALTLLGHKVERSPSKLSPIDMHVDGVPFDVKTETSKFLPRPEYRGRVHDYQAAKPGSEFLFCWYHFPSCTVYGIGAITFEQFMKESIPVKRGTRILPVVDDKVIHDHHYILFSQLIPFKERFVKN